MHYVMFVDWRPGMASEQQDKVLARRAEWQYPKGLRPIIELWLSDGSPVALLVFEADDLAPITELMTTWDDVFIVKVSPALTHEDGMRLGAQALNDWHQQSRVYRPAQ